MIDYNGSDRGPWTLPPRAAWLHRGLTLKNVPFERSLSVISENWECVSVTLRRRLWSRAAWRHSCSGW